MLVIETILEKFNMKDIVSRMCVRVDAIRRYEDNVYAKGESQSTFKKSTHYFRREIR